MFLDLSALRTHPHHFTLFLMGKLALNYARSSGTHSSHKMQLYEYMALFWDNSPGLTSQLNARTQIPCIFIRLSTPVTCIGDVTMTQSDATAYE
jgi:hypothetical protein